MKNYREALIEVLDEIPWFKKLSEANQELIILDLARSFKSKIEWLKIMFALFKNPEDKEEDS